MCEAPGSVVTLLCSGIQLYSAERRIADCILADVKRASMCTSAELARLSCSSEATVTRLCHKLGFENYRKFQLALARDAMEQQEAQRMRDEGQDELHQALLNILANREEELRATIQAIDTRQLRQILSLLRSCEVMEVVSEAAACRWPSMPPSGSATWQAVRFQRSPREEPCLCSDADPQRHPHRALGLRAERQAGRGVRCRQRAGCTGAAHHL